MMQHLSVITRASPRKKSQNSDAWVAVFLLLGLAAIIVQNSRSPQTSDTVPSAPGFHEGYQDGTAFGQNEGRLRHVKIGSAPAEAEGSVRARSVAPELQPGYSHGWSAGYSSGYDSSSK